MRLAIVSQEYPGVSDYSGGIGVQYRALAPALAAGGDEIHVVCAAPSAGAIPHQLDGVRVHAVPLGLIWPWHGALWARRVQAVLARQGPFDLVLGAEFRGELWRYVTHQSQGPAVTHLHTSSQQLLELRPGLTFLERRGLRTRLFLHMERRQAERSVALLAPGHAVLAWARSRWAGTRSLPAEVVPNLIDVQEVRRSAASARPPAAFPHGRGPVVVLPGRLEAHKGPQVLVEAMKRVWREHPDAQLVLIGREGRWGPSTMSDHLHSLADDASGRMHLLGEQTRAVNFATIAAADVVAIPSLWESFCLAAVEAMALRKPVVGTTGSGFSEYLRDGVNGRLVAPGDAAALATALGSLLADAADRERLSAAAGRTAEELDAVRVVPRYREALARLAAGPARRGGS